MLWYLLLRSAQAIAQSNQSRTRYNNRIAQDTFRVLGNCGLCDNKMDGNPLDLLLFTEAAERIQSWCVWKIACALLLNKCHSTFKKALVWFI
jgi:hypothetical protein